MKLPEHSHWLDEPLPEVATMLAVVGAMYPGEELARYGSWVWRCLAQQDARRVVAVYVAAEAWRMQCSTAAAADRLTRELAEEDRRCRRRWTAAMNDVRGEARMRNEPVPTGPAFADLADRRERVEPIADGRDWPRDESGDVL